jgi:hypothetical protein
VKTNVRLTGKQPSLSTPPVCRRRQNPNRIHPKTPKVSSVASALIADGISLVARNTSIRFMFPLTPHHTRITSCQKAVDIFNRYDILHLKINISNMIVSSKRGIVPDLRTEQNVVVESGLPLKHGRQPKSFVYTTIFRGISELV